MLLKKKILRNHHLLSHRQRNHTGRVCQQYTNKGQRVRGWHGFRKSVQALDTHPGVDCYVANLSLSYVASKGDYVKVI